MTVEAYQPKCNYINTAFISANVSIDLTNAKVLEIYGNAGQLLADPENVVKQENYTVFETSQEARNSGKYYQTLSKRKRSQQGSRFHSGSRGILSAIWSTFCVGTTRRISNV